MGLYESLFHNEDLGDDNTEEEAAESAMRVAKTLANKDNDVNEIFRAMMYIHSSIKDQNADKDTISNFRGVHGHNMVFALLGMLLSNTIRDGDLKNSQMLLGVAILVGMQYQRDMDKGVHDGAV